ncbi:MAG: S8 family serine peptidase [Bdellovibrionia bacterium]
MNFLSLLIFLVFAASCNSATSATQNHSPAPTSDSGASVTHHARVTCKPSSDPLSCLRTNCKEIGAQFNESQKRCECPKGKSLNTDQGFECVSSGDISPIADYLKMNMGGATLYANSTSTLQTFFERDGAAVGHTSTRGSLIVAKDPKDLMSNGQAKTILTGSKWDLFTVNWLNAPQLNISSSGNDGIADRMADLNLDSKIAFLEPNFPLRTGAADLDSTIEQSLALSKNVPAEENYISYTEAGCIDQCLADSQVLESHQFRVTRQRYYYGGTVVQDLITVFDRYKQEDAAALFLINGHLAYSVIQEGSETWLHGNEGSIAESRIKLLQTFPDRTSIPTETAFKDETPIVIFENAENANLAPIVPRGPWKQSHVFGWFKPQDEQPFFKNYPGYNADFGKEHLAGGLESSHPIAVANLASNNYQHPLIPLQEADLLNGSFTTFANNYSEALSASATKRATQLVASVSEATPMSPSACQNGPIGNAISAANSTLWVMGASNSGADLAVGKNICPQLLNGSRIIKVASSSDGERLVSSSAYGRKSVDIAEIGCRGVHEASCKSENAATSFAAPRLARKIADLANEFPMATPEQIRFAMLITARIPGAVCTGWNHRHCEYTQALPVRSGGFADPHAARVLLSELATHGWPDSSKLQTAEWVDLIVRATADQLDDKNDDQRGLLALDRIIFLRANQGAL